MKFQAVFILILVFCLKTYAQNNASGIDDQLYGYYQKCLANSQNEVVLSMSDTLFRMSGEKKDQRMQAVAMCTKLDYYFYYNVVQDSIISYVDRIKSFANATGQPKYFYHAWNRLVSYYIRVDKMRTAFLEIDKLKKDADAKGNRLAVMQAYTIMGRICTQWQNTEDALAYYERAERLIIDEKIDDQMLFHIYNAEAVLLTELGRYDEAIKKVDLARETDVNNSMLFTVYDGYAKIYNNSGRFKEAKNYIDSMEAIGVSNRNEWISLTSTQMRNQLGQGNYISALSFNQELLDEGSGLDYYFYRAQCFEGLGRYKEAINDYKHYYENIDSIRKERFDRELGEQLVIYEVNEIKAENQQLELELRTRWLLITIVAFTLLALVFIIVLSQLYRIRSLNRSLKKSEEIKSTFLKSLSHEIRTPLNSIVGFSDMLGSRDDLTHNETKRYTDIIVENSMMLLKLVSDALELSEVHTVTNYAPVDINDCCESAIRDIQPSCAEGVSMVFEPCAEDSTALLCKEDIEKVLSNLLGNAAKFTVHGSITIRTEYLSKSLFQISVTDTGLGIPIDKQESVFDSFYKVDTMTQGLGLGLTICRVIADYMNGSIKIDSSYVDGCRVLFVFPI